MIEKPPIGDPCNGCGLCCRAQVCGLGSFTLGLVKNYGERADGPCPAIVERDDGSITCGLVNRPKDYSPAARGSTHDLRAAAAMLIGAGIGCDEAGDDADWAVKLRAVQTRFLERAGPDRIDKAVKIWFGI